MKVINSKNHLMRSLMFVPAHNEKLIESASKRDADVLLFDLEDSVQPAENKPIARQNIIKNVQSGKFKNYQVYPRVNDRESGQLMKDILALCIEGIDGFMYPKAKRGDDIYFFDKLLETVEYEKGFPIGTFKIIALIETTSAVMNINEICAASPRLVAIAYGCEDFITDLGGIHDNEGKSLFTPRALIAMAAKANNIIPIDTVHINVHDLEHLEQNLKIAKILGFEGMLVLNPIELPLIHQYFSPSKEEVADAKEILRLSDGAVKEGRGVAVINNKFIGPPMVLSAKKVLERDKIIQEKSIKTSG